MHSIVCCFLYVCTCTYTHCKYSIIQFFCNIITMRWSQIILLKFWQAQVRVPRPSPAHQIQKGKVNFGLRPVTKIIKTTHPLTFRGSERKYIVSIPALLCPTYLWASGWLMVSQDAPVGQQDEGHANGIPTWLWKKKAQAKVLCGYSYSINIRSSHWEQNFSLLWRFTRWSNRFNSQISENGLYIVRHDKFHVDQCQAQIEIWRSPDIHLTLTWTSPDHLTIIWPPDHHLTFPWP